MSNDYYKNLPKKRMSAGVLILDQQDEILIVKPAYKDYWSIAGGIVEANESPRQACLREVKEEIGLDLATLQFLCVDYKTNSGKVGEGLHFLFFGGKLTLEQIKQIKVDGQEIVDFRFMKLDEVLPLLAEKMRPRLPKALEAINNNSAFYLEDGK